MFFVYLVYLLRTTKSNLYDSCFNCFECAPVISVKSACVTQFNLRYLYVTFFANKENMHSTCYIYILEVLNYFPFRYYLTFFSIGNFILSLPTSISETLPKLKQ